MKRQTITPLMLTLVSGASLAIAPVATAQVFSPTQDDLLNVMDVTVDFGGGGSLFDASLDGDGVLYDMDFAPGTDDISRVVLENNSPSFTDLAGFSAFDIIFEPQTFGLGVKTFLRTGDTGFFESNNGNIQQVSVDTPTRVELDLAGIPDLNDVRGFGIQIFDPSNGTSFATLAKATPAGPRPIVVEDRIFSFETGLENWGPSFQGFTSHALNTNPALASHGSQSLEINRTDADTAFSWGTEFYLNTDPENDDLAATDERPIVNATIEEVEEFAEQFEGPSRLAFDVVIDPSLLTMDPDRDETDPFYGFNIFLNDASGAFWQGDQQFTGGVIDFSLMEPQVFTFETGLSALMAAGTGADPNNPEFTMFTDGTDVLRMGISTNTNMLGPVFLDNIRLITEVFSVPGDADGDGDVDAFDLGLWQTQFGQTGEGLSADFDMDGDVDAFDLGIWQINFGTGVGAAVPEPASVAMIGAGLLMVVGRRRRA